MAPDGHAEIGYKITGICSAVNTLPAPAAAAPAHTLLCPLPHKHPEPQHLHLALICVASRSPQPAPTLHPNPALWDPSPDPCMLTPGTFHAPSPALEL